MDLWDCCGMRGNVLIEQIRALESGSMLNIGLNTRGGRQDGTTQGFAKGVCTLHVDLPTQRYISAELGRAGRSKSTCMISM
jgi:hypothetical protein